MCNNRIVDDKKQLQSFQKILKLISSEQDESRIVANIINAILTFCMDNSIRIRIGINDEEEKIVRIKYAHGTYDHFSPVEVSYNYDYNNSLTGMAFHENKTISFSLNKNPYTYGSKGHVTQFASDIRSFLAIPIGNRGKIVGVLTIDSLNENAFNTDIISLCEQYSTLLGSIISSKENPKNDKVIEYLGGLKRKRVLILGKDTGEELSRLKLIGQIIKNKGFVPVLVKEHSDIPELSNEEKVRLMADTSRFVILENSFPAGQIVECKICATNRIITACLREKNKGSSFMVTDYFKDFEFMREFEYENENESIEEAVNNAFNWAENIVKERIEYYDKIYPWRSKNNNQTP